MTYVVYDLETTGLNRQSDEITQIAAAYVENGTIVRRFCQFVRIQGEVPYEVSKLTGIYKDFLDKEGIPLKQALQNFKSFCGKNILIAHNGKSFDSKFLKKAFEQAGIPFENRQMDSMLLAKMVLPKQKSYRLGCLAEQISMDTSKAHRADADVEMLYHVLEELLFPASTVTALQDSAY